MHVWICKACGVEHGDAEVPPLNCRICDDERQFVPPTGQEWTTYEEMQKNGAAGSIALVELGMHRIRVEPHVGIGQQSMLISTEAGNMLWEPTSYVDDRTIEMVRQLGGVAAISSSHPHLTGASVSWSQAFDNVPIYAAEADKNWILRSDPAVTLWKDSLTPLPGITLVQCGGHFPGSSMLHWADGAEHKGIFLTGDTIFISPGQTMVSAMRSYPNRIPLPERAIRAILSAVEPYAYDRLYGSFGQVIASGAQRIVNDSLERYIAWLRGDVDDDQS